MDKDSDIYIRMKILDAKLAELEKDNDDMEEPIKFLARQMVKLGIDDHVDDWVVEEYVDEVKEEINRVRLMTLMTGEE